MLIAPALTALTDERAAGLTENAATEPIPAAPAESTQAAMLKQTEALQHEFAAVQDSAGVPRDLGLLAISAP